MKQLGIGLAARPDSSSGTFRHPFGFSAVASTDVDSCEVIMPVAGTLRNLRIKLPTAPGVGTSVTYTVFKNGSATAITVTISGTNVAATDSSNSIAVAAGDRIVTQMTKTGSPAGSNPYQSLEFEGDVAKENFIGGSDNSPSTSTTEYHYPPGTGVNATSIFLGMVIPHACTIKTFYLRAENAPGIGKTWTASIYKNGSQEVTTVVAITDAATTGNSIGLGVALSAGDRIIIQIVPAGTPASSALSWGIGFESTTDGDSIIPMVNTGGGPDTATTNYHDFRDSTSSAIWNTTGGSALNFVGPTGFTVKNMTVLTTAAPGAGNNYTFDVFANGTTGKASVLLSDAATTATGGDSGAMVLDDAFKIRSVPVSSPTATGILAISVTMSITAPVAFMHRLMPPILQAVKRASVY